MVKYFRKNWYFLAAAALVFLGFLGRTEFNNWLSSPEAAVVPNRQSQGRKVVVQTVKVRAGKIREKLLLTGALKPKEKVDVTSKVTGRVEKIYLDVGDSVHLGDLIAELESDGLKQQVNWSKAALAVTKALLVQREAELKNAVVELERAKVLSADGLISKQDSEAKKTSHDVVRAQVELSRAQQEQAVAELKELKIRLAQTKIYAPMKGQVAVRYVDVGAVVSPTIPILNLVNISTLVTAASVPEMEVGKLRVGNRAVVQVDALPNQSFTGQVARISPVLDAATRSATIEIEILNSSGKLRAEMFARVELDLDSTREAILIPREGLVYRGQQSGVFLVKGTLPKFQPIETGLTESNRVEVLTNLEPGTVIVGRGSSMIRKGDEIKPDEQVSVNPTGSGD